MSNKHKHIIYASWVAIAGNTILAVLKLVVGFISGSYAVIADGIDSATDIVSAIVTLIAAKIINKPPNIRYSYGYEKADTVATKVLSMVIFFAGAQLAITTIQKFFQADAITIPSSLAIYVTVFSMIAKLFLSIYLRGEGKNHKSNMLDTMGINMRNDILISASVLISLIFTLVFKVGIIDKIIALIISMMIMFEAVKIFLKTNLELMDGIDDPKLYEKLFNAIKKIEGAHNPHRTRVRKIGSYYMVNLDIEVEPGLTVLEAHDIAKNVEDSIKENIENVYDVMVHVEPKGNLEKDEKFGVSEKDIPKK